MRADLPTGTVTFLFSDIVGSTRLLEQLGTAEYALALGEHRSALRTAFGRFGGVEVDTQGDAFFVAFTEAPGAVAAAVAGQEALEGGRIRVRMGLHTGTPLVTGEGYVGTDVHRAARIAATAHGGQIVLSASTAALVPPDDLTDLGLHRLKDLSHPERIYQVGAATFPPLKSLHRTNLPVPATPFLGRDAEIAAVRRLLADGGMRLTTLTGPGGSGKTRLAMHAAALAADGFPDGIYWIPLAAVDDPSLVMAAIGAAIEAAGPLPAFIADKRMLLVLDNLEHLLDAGDRLAELLSGCPGLRLLITSRQPLGLAAEQQYALPTLTTNDATALFAARARAVDPSFAAGAEVAAICERLDHLPLAIELAAARVKVLSAGELLARLTERLPLLTTGSRDLPARHRTLRAAIAWSFELLTDAERRLASALAVFSGGFTLAAAEVVASADLDTLQALVDKSLVRHAEVRFDMLATIREFALDQVDDDAARRLHDRHASYFADLAASAHLSVEHFAEGVHHDLVHADLANIRAAIGWAEHCGDGTTALSITVDLEQYWVAANPWEGRTTIVRLLSGEPDALSPWLVARAMRVLGGVTYIVGEFEAGAALIEQALGRFRELGDDAMVGHLLLRLATEALRVGDRDRAVRLMTEAGSHPTVDTHVMALAVEAEIAWLDGRGDDALELTHSSAEEAAAGGFTWWRQHMLLTYADHAIELGRPELAAAPALEAVTCALDLHDRNVAAFALSTLAQLAGGRGDHRAAGVLWGAVEAESRRQPLGQWELARAELELHLSSDSAEFAAGRRQGAALTPVEAAAFARSLAR